MRDEKAVLSDITALAEDDDNIRAVYMNGSRANPAVEKDDHRDYDVVFSVRNVSPFVNDSRWLSRLGDIAIMQEPDRVDMALGIECDIEREYTYLILFADWVRIDLHIERVDVTMESYGKDSLTVPILDKDGMLKPLPPANDGDYHVKRPTAEQYAGCCCEFYWCLNNVAKGIVRRQLPYVMWMYNVIVHPMLTKMLCWRCAMEHDFAISLGKEGKYLEKRLPHEQYAALCRTYAPGDYGAVWRAAREAVALFSQTAMAVAERLGYEYRADWEQGIAAYMERMQGLYENER